MTVPVDPSMAVTGAEWTMPAVTPDVPAAGTSGGFGSMLSDSIESLNRTQADASQAVQAFAAGTVSDPTDVVMAVERARLSMQLAGQIRTKAVEALTDIFHTQV